MQRRIPTLLGILLTLVLVTGLAFTISQIGKVTTFFSRADETLAPKSPIETANVTESGFTVFWTTDTETTGAVFFGKTPNLGDGMAVDDRKDLTHFVRVTTLSPQEKYYFKVGSGSVSFGDTTKNGAPFEILTGPKLNATAVMDPIFGKVLDQSGVDAPGIIVVWEMPGATKIADLSKSDGSFVLPIASARSENLLSSFVSVNGQEEKISLTNGIGDKSVITCKLGLDRPIPTVKLGQNIDCEQNSHGFVVKDGSPQDGVKVNISDGETVSSPLPTISGVAGPNQIIKIEVHSSSPYSGTVKADPSGNWTWTPPSGLSAGQHTVTITVVNADGTTQTVTRNFTVNAGEQILPVTSGTPSATPAIPVATPSPTPTEPLPPAEPIVMPTPPQTGVVENTLVLLTLGIIFATLGVGITKIKV